MQYRQIMPKYKLLLKTGAHPRTHSLIKLVRKPTNDAERVKRLLKDIVMLTKIEDATRPQMPPPEIRKGGS